ncbi:MAG: hypothetical protein R3D46_17940 [Defluviimonas denitrificans]
MPPGTGIFAAAALGSLAAYIQWNGFQYHTIPLEGFALMACFWVLAHSTRPTPVAARVPPPHRRGLCQLAQGFTATRSLTN